MTPGKRRPQGTGSIFQRSDGLWIARIEAGFDAQGRRRRPQKASKTKAEAQRKLKEMLRAAASGAIPVAGGRLTVKAWSDEWLTMHERAVRPNVYVTDRGVVRKWIVPTLGARRLTDLTPADLRRLTVAVTDAGRSSSTAKTVHAVLRKMLRDARLEGHDVPARVIDAALPRSAASDRLAIPVDHVLAILRVIADRDDTSRWLFGMLYNVRQGEALGLTWDALDLDAATVKLEWQLEHYAHEAKVPAWLRTRHLVGRSWLVEPKTKARNATLPLLPFIVASLRAHRELSEPNPYGLVWVENGQPITDRADRAAWHAIQARADVSHPSGRPWHLHETRHTAASILIEEGVDPRIVASILGHSRLVDSYVHVDSAAVERALGRLAQRFQIEG